MQQVFIVKVVAQAAAAAGYRHIKVEAPSSTVVTATAVAIWVNFITSVTFLFKPNILISSKQHKTLKVCNLEFMLIVSNSEQNVLLIKGPACYSQAGLNVFANLQYN